MKCKISKPNQEAIGPGKIGKKLPTIPIKQKITPIIKRKISIVIFNTIFVISYGMANIKLFFILFIFFNSCNYYSQEKSNNDVQKETSWANTDEYPSTNDCDRINDKNLRIECFNKYISDLVIQNLILEDIKIKSILNDTVFFELTIDKNGQIILDKISDYNQIMNSIDNFEDSVKNIFKSLPKVLPATKTNLGVTVNSKIKLPVILKSN